MHIIPNCAFPFGAHGNKWEMDRPTQAKLQFLIVFKVRYWHIKYSVYLRGDEHKRQVCKCGRKSLDGKIG